ncbi:MAG: hypothetical protein M5U34_22960 [Chloroflexi bacterium]|nr:hypothetical protein [Chloroflexota bacterium]
MTVSLWWLATKQQAPLTTRLELYKRDNTGHIFRRNPTQSRHVSICKLADAPVPH